MVSRNYRVETKLHGRGVKFRETSVWSRSYESWFRSGVTSELFFFEGMTPKMTPVLTCDRNVMKNAPILDFHCVEKKLK